MAKLGITSDGAPYTRRLSSRTRCLNLYKKDLVSFQHTSLTSLTLSLCLWPNIQNLNLLAVPITEIDLLPLHAGQLKRFQCVEDGLGFEEDVISQPLYLVGRAKDVQM